MSLIETINKYKYWLLLGMIVSAFVLIMIMMNDIYRLQKGMELLWNRTEVCGLIR